MSVLPILPQGFVVGRILASRGDSADADRKADTAVVVGMVDFTPATPYRKLDAATVVTHSKMTAKLDSHGDLHPQRETSDNTGSDTEDGIWLPTGTWKVTYRLNTGMGALPEHNIEVTTAHTEADPLPLFANMGDAPQPGASYVTMQVPLNGQPGHYLVLNAEGSGLAWASGIPPETITDAVEDYLTANPPAGGGSSTITADDTPAAPAEGSSASYLVTSAVTWPAGLVWSTDPDGGVAPTITGTALVSLFTVGGVTRAIMGATFPGVVVPDTTAPAWSATLTTGTPAATSVVVAASALATDAVGVTGYERSLDGGSTWATITPSGLNFTLSGLTAATSYPAPKLRAKDAAGNYSTPLTAQAFTTASGGDVTSPTPGTLASSAITSSGFTLTVSGAADETALHATPYAYSTDNGTTWSAWQAGATYNATGLATSTAYQARHKVRDAAGNETVGTAVTVTTSAAVTNVSDTFTRADSTSALGTSDSGHAWTAISGTWGISSNAAYTSAGVDNDAAVVNYGSVNQDLSVKLSGTPRSFCGAVLRYTNAANHVLVYVSGTGAVELWTRSGGSNSEIYVSPAGAFSATSGVLRVVLNGSAWSVYVDGTLLSSGTSGALASQTGTQVGIKRGNASGARWDDFAVVAP